MDTAQTEDPAAPLSSVGLAPLRSEGAPIERGSKLSRTRALLTCAAAGSLHTLVLIGGGAASGNASTGMYLGAAAGVLVTLGALTSMRRS